MLLIDKRIKMRNIVIVLEYLGTFFSGWQSQKHCEAIQERVERAIYEVTGEHVVVTASGRTDVGVHARGQVATFNIESNLPCYKIMFGSNFRLAPYISIKECYDAEPWFNARKSAKRKTYCYRIYASPTCSPLRDYTWVQVYKPLDIEKMQQAAKYFEGEHDYTAFMAMGSNQKTTVRTIYSLEVKGTPTEIEIYVTGNAFLYNMVRIIAGTLVYVGQHKIEPTEIPSIIESKQRNRAAKTFPAKGLTLESVEYPPHRLNEV